jgi:hypothetical protein
MLLHDNNSGGYDSLTIPVVLLRGFVSTLVGMLVISEGIDVLGLGLTFGFGISHEVDTLSLPCFSHVSGIVWVVAGTLTIFPESLISPLSWAYTTPSGSPQARTFCTSRESIR